MDGNPNLTSRHVRCGDFRQAHLSQTLPGTVRPGSAGVPPAFVIPATSEPSFPRKRESTSIQGPWIPAFAGMTGFCRTCARVSIDPGAQAELCA